MNEDIGEAAGVVWRYLDTAGETTVTKLKQATKLDEPMLSMALGWLAREGKVTLTKDKRTVTARLDSR